MSKAQGSGVSAGRSSGQSPGCLGRGPEEWTVFAGFVAAMVAAGVVDDGRGGGGRAGSCRGAARGSGILCLPFICFLRRGQVSF